MTDKELMQQALYALEYASDMTKPENMSGCECPICVTITALRDRLAQTEQEPVAHTLNCVCGAVWDIKNDGSEEMVHTPDTPQPQRKPLTHPQIHELDWPDGVSFEDILLFARAIEAAHGIKP